MDPLLADEDHANELFSKGENQAAYTTYLKVFEYEGSLKDYRKILFILSKIEHVDLDSHEEIVLAAAREVEKSPDLLPLIGNYYFLRGSFAHALTYFDSAISTFPELKGVPSWILLRKLDILCKLNTPNLAEDWYALSKDQIVDTSHASLAISLLEQTRIQDPIQTKIFSNVEEIIQSTKLSTIAFSENIEAFSKTEHEYKIETELNLIQLHNAHEEIEFLYKKNLDLENTILELNKQLEIAKSALFTTQNKF